MTDNTMENKELMRKQHGLLQTTKWASYCEFIVVRGISFVVFCRSLLSFFTSAILHYITFDLLLLISPLASSLFLAINHENCYSSIYMNLQNLLYRFSKTRPHWNGVKVMCSGKVRNSCSTSGICRITVERHKTILYFIFIDFQTKSRLDIELNTVIQWKTKKYHTVGTTLKSDIKRGKIDTPRHRHVNKLYRG